MSTVLIGLLLVASITKGTRLQIEPTVFGPLYTSSGSLTFEGEGERITCNVTMNSSLRTTTAKTSGVVLGRTASATVSNPCSSNLGPTEVSFERLPWEIAYSSFGGVLPNISSVLVTERERVTKAGRCVYEGLQAMRYDITAGIARSYTYLPEQSRMRLISGIGCPFVVTSAGTFALNPSLRFSLIG
jgi:hypothetical protein